MGYLTDNSNDPDEMRDFTTPLNLTLENSDFSPTRGPISRPYLFQNPLMPKRPGDMAADDGNQPFALHDTPAYNDMQERNNALDNLTIPKDLYRNTYDNASEADVGANNLDQNGNGNTPQRANNTVSIAPSLQPPQSLTADAKGVVGASTNADHSGNATNKGSDGSNGNASRSTDDTFDKADKLSDSPSVVIGGTPISRSEYPNNELYIQAIFNALLDRESKRTQNSAGSQQTEYSGDASKNPGAIPGLSKSLQALVDKSYELAMYPSADVGGHVTERSHYNDQDGYRRMILRDLLAEIHGGYDKIPDSEAGLVNPYFDPNLAAIGQKLEVAYNIYQSALAGGMAKAAEVPEGVSTAIDWVSGLYGGK